MGVKWRQQPGKRTKPHACQRNSAPTTPAKPRGRKNKLRHSCGVTATLATKNHKALYSLLRDQEVACSQTPSKICKLWWPGPGGPVPLVAGPAGPVRLPGPGGPVRWPGPGGPVSVARCRWPTPSGPVPVARSRWPGPGGPVPVARSRWPGPGGPVPVARSRWPGPGGPVPVARSRWPGPGPVLRVCARRPARKKTYSVSAVHFDCFITPPTKLQA